MSTLNAERRLLDMTIRLERMVYDLGKTLAMQQRALSSAQSVVDESRRMLAELDGGAL